MHNGNFKSWILFYRDLYILTKIYMLWSVIEADLRRNLRSFMFNTLKSNGSPEATLVNIALKFSVYCLWTGLNNINIVKYNTK